PGTYDSWVSAPVVYGQNHMLSRNPYASADTAPYAASSSSSTRPRTRGRSPPPSPIQPAPSIWNGSHGPMPPVSSAEANIVVLPSTNPNPGPCTRPASTSRKNIGSTPPTPAPSGRSAAPIAESKPRFACALVSIPPLDSSASTTASRPARIPTNTKGASVVWLGSWGGATTSGHRYMARPAALTSASATAERARIRTARAPRCGAPSVSPP